MTCISTGTLNITPFDSLSTVTANSDLIHHNIGTHLKLNKYIFDISIPFCHHLYLFATFKQCFTEFTGHKAIRIAVYNKTLWVDVIENHVGRRV
jgi:hypothetical protein